MPEANKGAAPVPGDTGAKARTGSIFDRKRAENNRWKRRLLPLPILLGAAAVLWLSLLSGGLELTVADGAGTILHRFSVARGDMFYVSFTHSLAKSPVEEYFEITGVDEFRLRETVYADFGAGLPHEELPGQHMEFANGRIRLTGFNLAFRELRLRVGHIADHHVGIKAGPAVRLAELARPGAEIRLALRPRGG